MARYLLEAYLPRGDRDALERAAARAEEAARRMTRSGTAVRHVRSIFVPEDETCFVLFEAATRADVLRTGRLASLPAARVSEAIDVG